MGFYIFCSFLLLLREWSNPPAFIVVAKSKTLSPSVYRADWTFSGIEAENGTETIRAQSKKNWPVPIIIIYFFNGTLRGRTYRFLVFFLFTTTIIIFIIISILPFFRPKSTMKKIPFFPSFPLPPSVGIESSSLKKH